MSEIDDFEIRREFSKKVLKKLKKQIHFDTNTKFELPYEEFKKNNFPQISITTKGDWFTVKISFDNCDYKLNDSALKRVDSYFDNSIGIIEGYKIAIHPRKSNVPRYSTIGPSKIWINYPPIHKKFYNKVIKEIFKQCIQSSYHEKHR